MKGEYDSGSCEWDHMSKSQKIWAYVFFISIILWGAPIYESMFDIKMSWVMLPAGVMAVISGLFSGMIPLILKSLK